MSNDDYKSISAFSITPVTDSNLVTWHCMRTILVNLSDRVGYTRADLERATYEANPHAQGQQQRTQAPMNAYRGQMPQQQQQAQQFAYQQQQVAAAAQMQAQPVYAGGAIYQQQPPRMMMPQPQQQQLQQQLQHQHQQVMAPMSFAQQTIASSQMFMQQPQSMMQPPQQYAQPHAFQQSQLSQNSQLQSQDAQALLARFTELAIQPKFSDVGISAAELSQASGRAVAEVQSIMEVLCSEGQAYTTVDLSHFKRQ